MRGRVRLCDSVVSWLVELPTDEFRYLAGYVSIVEQARCLGLALSAELVDPGRVNIFERWESQSAVDAFHSSGPDDEQRPAMLTVSVEEYDVAGVRPLFGQGTA